jgi:X-Pro dipeptidyl-peptidase C-terminal non-catalytic domain
MKDPMSPVPRPIRSFVVLALALLPARIEAQCSDPAVPQGGFALFRVWDQPVTYGDGAKTLMDVRWPSAKPGPCGWPLIIVGQGFAATKSGPSNFADFLSAQGYMTVTFDVRGVGAAKNLNPASLGSEWLGRSELLDLAEIVRLIDTKFGKGGPGVADVTRLGITGFSYGGSQAWKAAAWSGRTLPTNNRGIKTFPVFKAACPLDAIPYVSGAFIIGGNALYESVVRRYRDLSVEYEPKFLAKVMSAFSTYNTAAFDAIWSTDPWRQDLTHLKSSTVPVMAQMQWWLAEIGVRALDAMPKTTPTRASLSDFGGHGMPRNDRQNWQKKIFTQLWFDRFLKGIKNQVDTEPRFVTGVMAETDALYRNRGTLLRHRYSATWGPAGTNLLKYYLRQGKVLSTTAPTTAEPPETIKHVVNSGSTWTGFVNGGGGRNLITAAFGVDSTHYDTPAQNKPLEIVGSPRVVIEVSPQASSTDYQLHCALYQVHNGTERYLQSGVAVVKGNSKAQRLDVDFFDIHVYLPAGDKLRLKIENLTRWYPAGLAPGVFRYYSIPFFKNSVVNIEHTAARPSWFEIPVAKTIQPSLTSATLNVDTKVPADVVFHVEGTPGADYLLAFGASGISPGSKIPGTALLNIDAVTDGMLALTNTAFLPNTLGKLNTAGSAVPQPRIALGGFPTLGSFVGLRLNAIAVLSWNNQLSASNPLDLFFR